MTMDAGPAVLVLLVNIVPVDVPEPLTLFAPPAVLVLLVNIAPVDVPEPLTLFAPPALLVMVFITMKLWLVALQPILLAQRALRVAVLLVDM